VKGGTGAAVCLVSVRALAALASPCEAVEPPRAMGPEGAFMAICRQTIPSQIFGLSAVQSGCTALAPRLGGSNVTASASHQRALH
jgi:hypothetical protein